MTQKCRKAGWETTEFVYLGLTDKVITEEIGGQIQRSYAYSAWGARLSQVTHDTDGTGPQVTEDSFYGYNPHTDVETLTSETGDTRATYGYTAYGKDDEEAFTGIDKPDAQNPGQEPYNYYRYNGKRWDPSSGSYDMGFRDYNPGLNRFTTRDSYNGALADMGLGTDPWTGNRYAFTAGNPISRVEVDGHDFQDIFEESNSLDGGSSWFSDLFDFVGDSEIGTSEASTSTAQGTSAAAPDSSSACTSKKYCGGKTHGSVLTASQAGHFLLDVAGVFPVVGEPADGANCAWYGAEGEKTNAALSCAGMVPVLGILSTIGKWLGKRLGKVGEAASIVPALPSPAEAADLVRKAKPVGSALKDDKYHRAASFVVDDIAEAGTVFHVKGRDSVNRILIQMPGEVQGRPGRFEWILNGGNVTHQMFVKGGSINGVPIKP